MGVIGKVAASVGVSLFVTMVVMALVTRVPGLEVPAVWWAIGAILPVALSGPISWYLLRQAGQIERLNGELRSAYAAMKQLAETDQLTGTWNRLAFDARVADGRRAAPGWFLLVDVDHFKGINDAFGHAAGDAALRHIGGVLGAVVGSAGVVGRIGGEEFAVWLASGDEVTALRTAEELRCAIAADTISVADARSLTVTASIGVTSGAGFDIDEAIHRADRAMYRAKQDGRNRVRLSA